MKMKYSEKPVANGTILDIPSSAKCLVICANPSREMTNFVCWLEEVEGEWESE